MIRLCMYARSLPAGVRVIVAGLDMDYLGKPFGQMPYLLSIADYITKLHAICMKCGNIANISYRKTGQEGQVLCGEKILTNPDAENALMKNRAAYYPSFKKTYCLKPPAVYIIWHPAIRGLYHICCVPVNGAARRNCMERPVLGDPVICLCKCGGQKFSGRKAKAGCYTSIHSRSQGFCVSQTTFQYTAYVADEYTKPRRFYFAAGQPVRKWSAVYFYYLGGMSLVFLHIPLPPLLPKPSNNRQLSPLWASPIIIPQLLLLIENIFLRLCLRWCRLAGANGILLIGLDIMVIALAMILFPFLWKIERQKPVLSIIRHLLFILFC